MPRPLYHAPSYRGASKLVDRVAIVTGGDSGIARAASELFACEGADVAIVYLPPEQADAEETAQAIRNEGRKALLHAGDVTNSKFCQTAVTLRQIVCTLEGVYRRGVKNSKSEYAPIAAPLNLLVP